MARQPLPQLFSHKGANRMHEPQTNINAQEQCPLRVCLCITASLHCGFDGLEIHIAQIIQPEPVQLCSNFNKLEGFERRVARLHR